MCNSDVHSAARTQPVGTCQLPRTQPRKNTVKIQKGPDRLQTLVLSPMQGRDLLQYPRYLAEHMRLQWQHNMDLGDHCNWDVKKPVNLKYFGIKWEVIKWLHKHILLVCWSTTKFWKKKPPSKPDPNTYRYPATAIEIQVTGFASAKESKVKIKQPINRRTNLWQFWRPKKNLMKESQMR